MSSSLWAKSSYTPEYSEELLGLVVEMYKEDIKPLAKDLKLSKMIDLIEVAEHHLELYKEGLMEQSHSKALRNYIVGLFYIYHLIPNSIQFQIKNRNHEIFHTLKQLYERETNMSNVKLQVINYIRYINDKQSAASAASETVSKVPPRPKRAQTLPNSALHQDLTSLLQEPEISKSTTISSESSAASITSIQSTSSSGVDDLWLPPDLQPNDQLKLLNENLSNDVVNELPPLPKHPPPSIPKLHHAKSFAYPPKSHSDNEGEDTLIKDTEDENTDGVLDYIQLSTSHRKDSYHSVYANDEYDTTLMTISSKALFQDLCDATLSYLILDIRSSKSFKTSHIPYGSIINIDPSLIMNSENYQELEDVLRNLISKEEFQQFKNMDKFDQVLTYSDNTSFLTHEIDYLTKLAMFLESIGIKSKTLSGGFDSWVKYVSRNKFSSQALIFRTRLPRFFTDPPSIPPPPPPPPPPISQHSSTPLAPYDYSKLLPPYSSSPSPSRQLDPQHAQGIHLAAPVPPPHLQKIPYQRPAAPVPMNQAHYTQLPQNINYQGIGGSHKPQHQQVHSRPRINSSSIPTIQQSRHPFVRLSITGLRNMKNTCYINSMIQCLFSSNQFRDLFLDNTFETYYNPLFKRPRLSPSLSVLFKKMYLNGGCSIVPSGFLKACVQLRPDLNIPVEQQDTQEFLMFLLDQLHDELSNSNSVVSDYPELMNHENLGEDYEKWFEGLIKQGFSPLSKIFQGQLQDSVKCMNCGFKSSNYSSFYMLSLGIPKHNSYGKKLKKVTLEDCIKLFTNDEILTGDNAWDCPKCSSKASSTTNVSLDNKVEKEPRRHRLNFGNGFRLRGRSSSPAPNAKNSSVNNKNKKFLGGGSANSTIKSLTFVSLPPILIIHLSRFLFYDTSQKDDTIIQYPILLEIDFNGTKVKYKLYGVVNHYGTLKSGHYTSITNKSLDHDLHDPNWYYFDDEVVKATNHGSFNGKDPTHMSSSDVYVLFYERVN